MRQHRIRKLEAYALHFQLLGYGLLVLDIDSNLTCIWL